MQDAYKNIAEYQTSKKCNVLIVFDDMIANMIAIKNRNLIGTRLFIRARKLNIPLVFITQSYSKIPKDVSLNYTHFSITKIPNEPEVQQITFGNVLDIAFKYFMNLYEKCAAKLYSFLVIHTALASDNHLCFRENYSERI